MSLVIDPYRFATAFNPLTSITWVAAWWASDPSWSNPGNGNAVSSWRDGTGNGYDLTQGTSANQPTYRSSLAALNSQPGVDFDGNDLLVSSSPSTATPFSQVIIASAMETVPSPSRTLIGGANGGVYLKTTSNKYTMNTALPSYSETQGPSIVAAGLIIAVFNTTSSKLIVNGTSTAISNASFDDPSVNAFLGATSNGSVMDVAFAGIYSGDITADAQYAAFKTWVASTYGLTIS